MMIEAYRMLAERVDYPFHLGVTEAGTPGVGTIKSAVGLGAVLSQGIGDTIRVSLSADPTEEVRVGIDILKSLGLRKGGLTFVSCPSCGRADVDLVKLAKQVEDEFRGLNEEIHIAVMGCVPEGQCVVTAAGPTPIEHVDEGSEVLTHEGEYRKVLWATRHAFDGELIEVEPAGFQAFRVTPNHPVLAAPRADVAHEWIRADQLSKGWILAYPVQEQNVERARIDSTVVKALRHVAYTGHVHNLEVEGIHSYAVAGAALHNCEVNGPGEARAADIGVAGGRGIGLIFKGGEVIRKVPEAEIVTAMREEVDKFIAERKHKLAGVAAQ
jgi:4-hydroxy-3-methylbut-2-en-1-yl diphosphate synthase IspG/GcpE